MLLDDKLADAEIRAARRRRDRLGHLPRNSGPYQNGRGR